VQILEDDAIQLLKKWLDDDIPVSLRILAPGLSASLAGFVSAVDGSKFSITNLTSDGMTAGEFTLELSKVKLWNYRDVRESTEEAKKLMAGRVASALQFQMDGIECVIYEIIEKAWTADTRE
jgi:hypothetical protein